MSKPKLPPLLTGTLAMHAHLRVGARLFFGPAVDSSLEITTDQAFDLLARGLDKMVWTRAPETTERARAFPRAPAVETPRAESSTTLRSVPPPPPRPEPPVTRSLPGGWRVRRAPG